MKIALTTHGTRGDVQPFVAVALALAERGHEVTLAVPPNLVEWVRRCGVQATQIAIDSQAFMESDQGRKWLAAGDVATFMKHMSKVIREHRDVLIEDQTRACSGAELIVAGFLTEDHSAVMAESLGVPIVALHLAPLRRTADFAHPLVTTRALPLRSLRKLTGALFEKVWWDGYRDDVNTFRQRRGLAPARTPTARRQAGLGGYTIQAFSRHLVPQPGDWGETMPIVGGIRFPARARERLGELGPDPELAAWVEGGTPPVYFGLGSMPVADPEAMLRMVSRVAERSGVRALVGAGWSGLDAARALPDGVRVVGAVDHGWLFPRCAAAMHHGGAGTLFAVASAGLPSIVTSVFADQPYWGRRAEQCGIGVHVPFSRLTEQRLEKALGAVLSPEMRARARSLGATLSAEPDATPRIVELLEQVGRSAARGAAPVSGSEARASGSQVQ